MLSLKNNQKRLVNSIVQKNLLYSLKKLKRQKRFPESKRHQRIKKNTVKQSVHRQVETDKVSLLGKQTQNNNLKKNLYMKIDQEICHLRPKYIFKITHVKLITAFRKNMFLLRNQVRLLIEAILFQNQKMMTHLMKSYNYRMNLLLWHVLVMSRNPSLTLYIVMTL